MFYVVDSNNYPLTRLECGLSGEGWLFGEDESRGRSRMSADTYVITWASLHDLPARWYVFPR